MGAARGRPVGKLLSLKEGGLEGLATGERGLGCPQGFGLRWPERSGEWGRPGGGLRKKSCRGQL